MKKLLFIFLTLISINSNSQNLTENNSEGFTEKAEAKNFIDSNGLKQGKWIEYLAYIKNYKLIDVYSLNLQTIGDSVYIELPSDSSATFYRLIIYKNGKFSGKERIYDLNGYLIRELSFEDGRSLYKTVFKKNSEFNIEIEKPLLNEKVDGLYKVWYKQGSSKYGCYYSETTYAEGKPIGVGKTYRNSNKRKLLIETPYYDGNRDGVEKWYWEDGTLMYEIPFLSGKKHGVEKHYWTDGSLLREEPYVNGKKHGKEKEYYSNGILEKESTFVNGFKNGIERTYSEDSRLLTETKYNEGISTETENYAKKSEEMNLLDAFLIGAQIVQTGAAVEQYKNNPTTQTANNLANVVTNNLTKERTEAVQSNFNTLNNNTNSESSASTNRGNTTSNTYVQGSNPAAEKCAADTKSAWEKSTEYQNYMNNKSCHKYAYISQKKHAEMILSSCRQYLSPTDINGFNNMISTLQSQINSMEECKIYFK